MVPEPVGYACFYQGNTYVFFTLNPDEQPIQTIAGSRTLLTLVLEHRGCRVFKTFIELIPKIEGPDWRNQARLQAFKLIGISEEEAKKKTFFRLISFNNVYPPIKDLKTAKNAIDMITKEIESLKVNGRPTRIWSHQRNQIQDWRKVFELMQKPLQKMAPKDQALSNTHSTTAFIRKKTHRNNYEIAQALKIIEDQLQIIHNHLKQEEYMLKKVLVLGSEFNATRGDSRSMDEITKDFLQTGEQENLRYFQILRAQLASLDILNTDLFFDDVSRIPAGGTLSSPEAYSTNITKSRDYHEMLLKTFKPDLIVIGGGLAAREYIQQILSTVILDHSPIVLRIRNPSPQAHRGSTEVWIQAYRNNNCYLLLEKAIQQHPSIQQFALISHLNEPWRIEPLSTTNAPKKGVHMPEIIVNEQTIAEQLFALIKQRAVVHNISINSKQKQGWISIKTGGKKGAFYIYLSGKYHLGLDREDNFPQPVLPDGTVKHRLNGSYYKRWDIAFDVDNLIAQATPLIDDVLLQRNGYC